MSKVTILRAPEFSKQIVDGPSIFLAGPIQDAPPWHEDAIRILSDMLKDWETPCTIACPKRSWKPRPLTNAGYRGQVAWEIQHLRYADVVMFWLPVQETYSDRPYAQTTRFELGETFSRSLLMENVRFIIGMEKGFPNERYIRTRMTGLGGLQGRYLMADPIRIRPTLKATCKAAVNLLKEIE